MPHVTHTTIEHDRKEEQQLKGAKTITWEYRESGNTHTYNTFFPYTCSNDSTGCLTRYIFSFM